MRKKKNNFRFILLQPVFSFALVLFVFFFFSFALADSVDTNSTSISGSGTRSSSTSFVTWATVGGISGNSSSTSYNTLVGFYYDNLEPVTLFDYNRGWQIGDQNVQFNCSDDDSGCKLFSYSLDDVNYSFPWGGIDQNIGVKLADDANHHIIFYSTDYMDNNESARDLYVGVDQNNPVIVITAPTNGATQGTTVVFSFLATAVSGIKNYWARIDSGQWENIGSAATYSYSLGNSEILPSSHLFYVKATSNSDLNSNVASKAILFESASGGGIIVITPGPAQPTVQPIIEKKIFEIQKSFPLLGQPNLPVFDETEKQPDLSAKRFATQDELDVKRTVKVYSIIGEGGIIKYSVRVTITVENIGTNTLYGIETIEAVGKDVVESTGLIRSKSSFEVIEESPPIMRFSFGELDPGQKKSVSYDFDRNIEQGPLTKEMLELFKPPTALIKLTKDDLCMGAQCTDFNPCTRDYCVRGECRFVTMNDGAKCGNGLVCRNAKCTSEISQAGIVSLPLFSRFDYLVLIVLFAAFCFAITLQYTLRRFMKEKRQKKEK